MPRNSLVHHCVDEVKKKKPLGNAIAICQSSTGQSYHTGRSLKSLRMKYRRKCEYEEMEHDKKAVSRRKLGRAYRENDIRVAREALTEGGLTPQEASRSVRPHPEPNAIASSHGDRIRKYESKKAYDPKTDVSNIPGRYVCRTCGHSTYRHYEVAANTPGERQNIWCDNCERNTEQVLQTSHPKQPKKKDLTRTPQTHAEIVGETAPLNQTQGATTAYKPKPKPTCGCCAQCKSGKPCAGKKSQDSEQQESHAKRTKPNEFSTRGRERRAESGVAMPDGSFPINDLEDLKNAIHAIGRAKNPAAARRHIMERARVLKAESHIPSEWHGKRGKS